MDLQSEIDRIHQQLRQKKQQGFRQIHSNQAKIITEILSDSLIDALNIRLEENDNFGTFVFEHNNQDYCFKSFDKGSGRNPSHVEIDRVHEYTWNRIFNDEDLLKYLAEDRDRKDQPKLPSIGSTSVSSDGISYREWLIGKALSRSWISPKRAIELADETIRLLDAEITPVQFVETKSWSFEEVLSWYEPEQATKRLPEDIPF